MLVEGREKLDTFSYLDSVVTRNGDIQSEGIESQKSITILSSCKQFLRNKQSEM